MLEMKELNIHDKNLFDKYFGLVQPKASEMTFTNLFMWRHLYKIRFAVEEGILLCICDHRTLKPFALMPMGADGKVSLQISVEKLKQYFHNRGWSFQFRKVTGDQLPLLLDVLDDLVGEVQEDRDDSDYVYNSSDLITLKGKKFDGKRNHINQFKKAHSLEYVKVGADNIEECRNVLMNWYSGKSIQEQIPLENEKIANIEMINYFMQLGVEGALIKVDGSFEAFTAGEMLNSDMAVIHIEKANPGINGLYTITNQQFCENTWKHTSYINREQDLGIAGIRKAKLSYQPVRLETKYTVFIAS